MNVAKLPGTLLVDEAEHQTADGRRLLVYCAARRAQWAVSI